MRFKIVASVFFLASFCIARADRAESGGCYAEWEDDRLTVGNALFERSWVAGEGGLAPVSFLLKNSDTEWLRNAGGGSGVVRTLDVTAREARRSAVGAVGLYLQVVVDGKNDERAAIWVFPDASGALIEVGRSATGTAADVDQRVSGIEVEDRSEAPDIPVRGVESLAFAPLHLRTTHLEMRDQTDKHNELVLSREWLLTKKEANFDLRGCVLIVENVLDGTGLVFLKLSPLPHARPDREAVDFKIKPPARSVTAFFNGYPVAVLGYNGGRVGRIRALQAFQRSLREHVPGRDGLFLSNTWGDRSRDARINEEFLLKEIDAGAELGVDVVQIDDGWQKGRTANSSDARGKGVWNGYWDADPDFWDPDPRRFPGGLEKVVGTAREKGMQFGLWFGPDSSNNAVNWKKDADHLLRLHHDKGVDYFKIDSMKTYNAKSLERQRAMFDRMLDRSDGEMVFDLDVTAEIRPGYFGLPDIGPLFVENRYTDFHSYWPHQTLRNLWMLSQVVDPLRLRMEFLNNTRNVGKYTGDPLAPALYKPDTLFATVMMANPLGWFEVSNLPSEYVEQLKPLVAVWKSERARMHGGTIIPVGRAPDGFAWTGFVSIDAGGEGGYALLFRELNDNSDFTLELERFFDEVSRATVLGGRGTVQVEKNSLVVNVPNKLDFIWVELE